MADNTQISDNPIVASDDIDGVQYQRVKVVWGADGVVGDTSAANPMPVGARITDGTTTAGVVDTGGTYDGAAVNIIDKEGLPVGFGRPVTISVIPTLDTSQFASGDLMTASVITFADVVDDANGTGHILAARFFDKDNVGQDMSLLLFDSSVTPGTVNAAHTLSTNDIAKYIDVIHTSGTDWESHGNGKTVTVRPGPPIPFHCSGSTSMFGLLVSKGTGTYTATNLTIELTVLVD